MINKIIYVFGLGLVASIGFAGGARYNQSTTKTIPNQEKVASGYIAPNQLEILCYDHDSDNIPETEIRIGEKRYLLRNLNGKPVLSRFRIWSGHRPVGDGKYEVFPCRIELLE